MFNRYTEKARRVIFFARYEASQFGNPYIETAHLLLGLLREDPALVKRFLGPTNVATDVRTEIERQIIRHERISTAVEMPLTNDCKMALNLAAEESERLAHRHIGTEHLLLGMLRVEGSLAAKLLRKRGLNPEAIREELAKPPGSVSLLRALAEPSRRAITTLESFLSGLKSLKAEELISFLLMLLENDGITKKFARHLKPSSLPTQRKIQVTLSRQRWRKQASYLSLRFFGRMPFWPANNVPGCTE